MTKRAVIIIDGSNLFLSMKKNGKNIWPTDLKKILLPQIEAKVDSDCEIYYFTAADKKNKGQMRSLEIMRESGLIVYDYELEYHPDNNECNTCNSECPECGRNLRTKPHKEKMVDIAISTKMMELGYGSTDKTYDIFIIVSGDKDLIPTIKFLRQKLNKKVIIVGFRHQSKRRNTLSYALDVEANKIINLNDLL